MKLFLPTLVSTERITRDMWFLGILHITLATHCYVCDGESCLDPWKNVKDADQYKQDCNDFGFIEDGGCSKRKYYDAESKVYMGKLLSCVCTVIYCEFSSGLDRTSAIIAWKNAFWWVHPGNYCHGVACTIQWKQTSLDGHRFKPMLHENWSEMVDWLHILENLTTQLLQKPSIKTLGIKIEYWSSLGQTNAG